MKVLTRITAIFIVLIIGACAFFLIWEKFDSLIVIAAFLFLAVYHELIRNI